MRRDERCVGGSGREGIVRVRTWTHELRGAETPSLMTTATIRLRCLPSQRRYCRKLEENGREWASTASSLAWREQSMQYVESCA